MNAGTSLRAALNGVAIYADDDAFSRDQFGRKNYLEMKPVHDELYELAIKLKLATSLVIMQRQKPIKALLPMFSVALERCQWYPANISPTRSSLLIAPVTAFERSWLALRGAVESTPKVGPLWHDDPALVFEPSAGQYLCRTACIGHEGGVLYFAYKKEKEWLAALSRAELRLIGAGGGGLPEICSRPGSFR